MAEKIGIMSTVQTKNKIGKSKNKLSTETSDSNLRKK